MLIYNIFKRKIYKNEFILDDRVYLIFTHMDLHADSALSSADAATRTNCTQNYVRVRDGDDSDAPLVGTYCITRVPPPITSQVCFAVIYFKLNSHKICFFNCIFRDLLYLFIWSRWLY